MPSTFAILQRRGRVAIVAPMVIIASVALGNAASLSVAARPLGATTVSIGPCTSVGMVVVPELTASVVTSTTLETVPAECAGATLRVTVDSGLTVGVGSITVPTGGGALTVPIVGGPELQGSTQTVVLLEGP